MTETEPAAGRRAIVVMGVAGSGKTAVGKELAARRGVSFLEGDQLHPEANIRKMSSGMPLQDEDRWPWLESVARRIAAEQAHELVATCSALKRSYRDLLRRGSDRPLIFVFLDGSRELLATRIRAREGHFMPADMLKSQLADLEDPSGEPGAIRVDIDGSVEEIVTDIEAALTGLSGR